MANDFTMHNEESRQIVPPAWTKLVSKAGDIVRNQKANMKSSPVVQTPPTKEQRLDVLGHEMVRTNYTDTGHLLKDAVIHDIEALEELNSEPSPSVILSQKIEEALREAKRESLQCEEVLVPCDLISRIAKDVIGMSEHEPCGLRGCLVIINLEDKNVFRKIGKLKIDRDTVATFELHLTLRRDSSNWLSLKQLVPSRLLKRIGRTPALIVSEVYTLSKKKLYRSST